MKYNISYFFSFFFFLNFFFNKFDFKLKYTKTIETQKLENTEDEKERKKRMWRVKLILTSIDLDPLTKHLGKLKKWKYGMVHVALQIGHTVIGN